MRITSPVAAGVLGVLASYAGLVIAAPNGGGSAAAGLRDRAQPAASPTWPAAPSLEATAPAAAALLETRKGQTTHAPTAPALARALSSSSSTVNISTPLVPDIPIPRITISITHIVETTHTSWLTQTSLTSLTSTTVATVTRTKTATTTATETATETETETTTETETVSLTEHYSDTYTFFSTVLSTLVATISTTDTQTLNITSTLFSTVPVTHAFNETTTLTETASTTRVDVESTTLTATATETTTSTAVATVTVTMVPGWVNTTIGGDSPLTPSSTPTPAACQSGAPYDNSTAVLGSGSGNVTRTVFTTVRTTATVDLTRIAFSTSTVTLTMTAPGGGGGGSSAPSGIVGVASSIGCIPAIPDSPLTSVPRAPPPTATQPATRKP